MTKLSEFRDSDADGVGTAEELARPPLRPPRRRRLRRLAPLAAALAVAGLVAVWVPLHRSAPGGPARPVRPPAGSPGPSTATFATVDSPVTDPAPLPDRPLPPAALLYARCGGMGAVGGDFPDDCRYRLVLTDGSQYTLPISARTFGPGSISPDGAYLLMRDTPESLILRHLPTGTSRRVTIPSLKAWGGVWGPIVWSPGGRRAAVVIAHDDGIEEAVAVLDTAGASVLRTVDVAAVAAAGHDDPELVTDRLAVVTDSGGLSWYHLTGTGMNVVHWSADERRPRVVDVDLRPHLRPGELLADLGHGVMLGDGVTAAVPVGRTADRTEEAGLRQVHAILLVDVTTGTVRHRQELSPTIVAGELLGSGCGLGPDVLVLPRFDGSDPAPISPTSLITLDPWTGARGQGYQLSPGGFPTFAC